MVRMMVLAMNGEISLHSRHGRHEAGDGGVSRRCHPRPEMAKPSEGKGIR
jgi:hypothetical protein